MVVGLARPRSVSVNELLWSTGHLFLQWRNSVAVAACVASKPRFIIWPFIAKENLSFLFNDFGLILLFQHYFLFILSFSFLVSVPPSPHILLEHLNIVQHSILIFFFFDSDGNWIHSLLWAGRSLPLSHTTIPI